MIRGMSSFIMLLLFVRETAWFHGQVVAESPLLRKKPSIPGQNSFKPHLVREKAGFYGREAFPEPNCGGIFMVMVFCA